MREGEGEIKREREGGRGGGEGERGGGREGDGHTEDRQTEREKERKREREKESKIECCHGYMMPSTSMMQACHCDHVEGVLHTRRNVILLLLFTERINHPIFYLLLTLSCTSPYIYLEMFAKKICRTCLGALGTNFP